MNGLVALLSQHMDMVAWLAAMIVLLVIEAATVQLVCVWFAVGALAGAVAAMTGLSVGVQIGAFIVVSALCLILTRKFVRGVLKVKKVPTNADSVIGMCGSVIQEIDNLAQTGRVRVSGLDWTARTETDGVRIPVGQTVLVKAIEGVKLIVETKI